MLEAVLSPPKVSARPEAAGAASCLSAAAASVSRAGDRAWSASCSAPQAGDVTLIRRHLGAEALLIEEARAVRRPVVSEPLRLVEREVCGSLFRGPSRRY